MNDKSETAGLTDAAGDLLRGAQAIAAFLRAEGLTDVTESQIYYFARVQKLPIGRWNKELIASKKRLSRDLRRAALATAP
jgi:hypothetical protein